MAKTIETVREHCKHKDCAYRGHLSNTHPSTCPTCDYILFEHRSRNCKISECQYYRKGKRHVTSDVWSFISTIED